MNFACFAIEIVGEVEVVQPAGSADANETPLIVTYTGSTDVFVEGALDVPGATVEVVETDPQPVPASSQRRQPPKGAPAYREGLLLK